MQAQGILMKRYGILESLILEILQCLILESLILQGFQFPYLSVSCSTARPGGLEDIHLAALLSIVLYQGSVTNHCPADGFPTSSTHP